MVFFFGMLYSLDYVFTEPERVDDDVTGAQQNYPRIAVDGDGRVY